MSLWDRISEGLKERSPWVAALLNVIWGFGYLYAGRKKLVGVSFLILIFSWTSMSMIMSGGRVSATLFYSLTFGSVLFVSFALARDAYIEAKKRNEEIK